MAAVTPPRRSAFQRLSDIRSRHGKSHDESHIGIPLPPLYYKKTDQSEDGTLDKGWSQKNAWSRGTTFLHASHENKASSPVIRTPLGTNKNKFLPIERPSLPRSIGTPPMSPVFNKQGPIMASPAPSLLSLSMTEDESDGSLTPTPKSSYLQVASINAYPGPRYQWGAHPSHRSGGRSTAGDTSRASLSPHKSPSKYSQHRRSTCVASPLSHATSPHSITPYSPGASSISSHSTSADDATRKQRVKTELCMHFTSGRVCPFGVNCTYAHGEAELQMTKLMDLHRAGLIEDVETYRTKPCLTWVATGSCPFGKRCASIHDPRIIGPASSWLPHTETQGNSMSTDINVDGLHQKRLAAILHNNPFGEHFSMSMDEFGDLYKLVCNTLPSNKRRRNNLSEIHKLAIALEMRGGHNWMYKYRPQHVIYDELCMVLQKRAFCLEKSGKVTPLTISTYNPKNCQHVIVRELAFGPDADSTVRDVALWFNIPEKEVSECTPQQAKRFRWKKPNKYDDKVVMEKSPSAFDLRECFVMIRPNDQDAFDLATKMLQHRHETVRAERLSTLSERFEALKDLGKSKEILQVSFENQKRSWISWAWPINIGRQVVDHETPVPPVDGQYLPLLDREALERTLLVGQYDDIEPVKGSAIEPIWDSFVSTCLNIKAVDPTSPLQSSHALSVFAKLASGEAICPDRNLPHISTGAKSSGLKTHDDGAKTASRQSEQCWKALLLKNQDSHSLNVWDTVLEHFQNARCKKVLTIIQK